MRAILFLALIALTGCAQSVPLVRPTAPREVVVSRFMVDIEGLETSYTGEASGLVPAAIRIGEAVGAAREAIEALRNPERSPYKAAFDGLYQVAEGAFASELDVRLLPLDTLRGEVPYVFGYPSADAARVARQGIHAGALELLAEVTFPDQQHSEINLIVWGKSKVRGRPELTLRVNLVGREGEVLWRDHVRVRSREPVTISDRWIMGVRTGTEVEVDASLHDLMSEAVARLIQKTESR